MQHVTLFSLDISPTEIYGYTGSQRLRNQSKCESQSKLESHYCSRSHAVKNAKNVLVAFHSHSTLFKEIILCSKMFDILAKSKRLDLLIRLFVIYVVMVTD